MTLRHTRRSPMGFLKRFFRNVFREGNAGARNQQLRAPQRRGAGSAPGRRRATATSCSPSAVRPSYDLQVVPCQGYRHDSYRDEQNHSERAGADGRRLAANSSSRSFMDLLDPLGFAVDVVLETSHNRAATAATPTCTASTSTCRCSRASSGNTRTCCSTTAAPAWPCSIPAIPQEVQFDEHKLLIVYGEQAGRVRADLRPARRRAATSR